MKRKYFIRTLIISLSAMLLFGLASGLLIGFSTDRLLKDDLLRLSDIIKDEARRENANLSNLVSFDNSSGRAFRITFIDADGDVAADSLDGAAYDNHLSRPEVQAALAGKPVFVKRYSSTFQKRLMYYAVTFTYAATGETYVLRVAIETAAVTDPLLISIPVLAVIVAGLAAALVLVNQKYNNAVLLPLAEIKEKLHTLNSGSFEKVSVDKDNADLLPVINEINEIAESLNALNRVRSDFFANASHELNTPLTYIAGYAELMEKGLLDDRAKIADCGQKIGEQAARMNNLITDMLKLSRLENTEEPVTLAPIDLTALLAATADTLKLQAEERGITIRLYCYEENPVISDEKLLKDILSNLMQNAVKYNIDGGRVDVTVKKSDKNLVIAVADTGIGIEKRDQARIFERFFRVDKARSRMSGGTGLGLAIVKHAAQKLNGAVTLDSTPGKGSKFTVTLPLEMN